MGVDRYYAVNTFISQAATNYDIAIEYYRQKTQILIQTLQNQLKQQAIQELQEIPNVEQLFEEAFNNYNQSFQPLWETIYSQHYSQSELSSKLKEWQNIVQNMDDSISNGLSSVNFLEYLANGTINNSNLNLDNTKGIDFSAIEKTGQKIIKESFTTAKSYGGARGRYLGEIFEQGAGLVLQNSLGAIMSIMQLGSEKSRSASNLGRKTYGKTDYGFISISDISIIDDDNLGKAYLNKQTGEVIPLEAIEVIDLQSNSAQGLMDSYLTGSKGLIAGATMKQWTNEMITSVSRTSGGSFGRSQLSQKFVNDRQPNGISEYFAERSTFEDYTAYAISRFLLNVIGVYNIIMASGSEVGFTYNWLDSLRNSARLVHVISNNNGKFWAYPAIKVVSF